MTQVECEKVPQTWIWRYYSTLTVKTDFTPLSHVSYIVMSRDSFLLVMPTSSERHDNIYYIYFIRNSREKSSIHNRKYWGEVSIFVMEFFKKVKNSLLHQVPPLLMQALCTYETTWWENENKHWSLYMCLTEQSEVWNIFSVISVIYILKKKNFCSSSVVCVSWEWFY